jgi:DNA-binding NarL/FixJ family response regulator
VTWKSATTSGSTLRGFRVLIAEDEALIALELVSVLSDEGAEVVGPASNLPQGLKLANRSEISAAVLDVRLGSDSVEPLASALRARGVPFAFYTGQADADAMRQTWPNAPVIAKPCPSRVLVEVIGALCGSAPPSA